MKIKQIKVYGYIYVSHKDSTHNPYISCKMTYLAENL